MKVVINTCYGGFGLSQKALDRLHMLGSKFIKKQDESDGLKYEASLANNMFVYDHDFRTDELVVQVVKELGRKAWGDYAKLKVITIPDDVQWEINEHGGNEEIREVSRRWS